MQLKITLNHDQLRSNDDRTTETLRERARCLFVDLTLTLMANGKHGCTFSNVYASEHTPVGLEYDSTTTPKHYKQCQQIMSNAVYRGFPTEHNEWNDRLIKINDARAFLEPLNDQGTPVGVTLRTFIGKLAKGADADNKTGGKKRARATYPKDGDGDDAEDDDADGDDADGTHQPDLPFMKAAAGCNATAFTDVLLHRGDPVEVRMAKFARMVEEAQAQDMDALLRVVVQIGRALDNIDASVASSSVPASSVERGVLDRAHQIVYGFVMMKVDGAMV